MPNDRLVKAANLVEQAREIRERTDDGQAMPRGDAEQIDKLLREASNLRKDVERDTALDREEKWLSEPEYKHDMGAGGARSGDGRSGAGAGDDDGLSRRTKAFLGFVRKGHGVAPEHKADLVEDATGELVVPVDYAGTIVKDIANEAVIRDLAFVRPTSSSTVDVGNVVINTAGWGKLETGTVPTDGLGTPPADKDTIKVEDLNALVKLGRDELEDSDANLAEIIRAELGRLFAQLEDDAFADGDGVDKPTGMAANTGITLAAAAGETVTADELKSLRYRIKSGFDRNGVYLAHSDAEEQAALLKDANDNYLWQMSVREGEPATFAGRRWYRVDGLPAPSTTVDGAGAGTDPSVVYGDVKAAYMVADRRRFTVQRLVERYAEEGKVGLLFTHRVGGGVIRADALVAYLL